MSLTYRIETSLPPCCTPEKDECRCSSCVVVSNPERCGILLSMAKERLRDLQEGRRVSANAAGARYRILTDGVKKTLPLDSDFNDYKEDEEDLIPFLSENQLASLADGSYHAGLRSLMRTTVRHLVQNRSEETLRVLSSAPDRLVELMRVGETYCVVKKLVTCPSEILIHEQLYAAIRHDPYLVQLIPTPYSARRVADEHYQSYMEYIKGPTLAEALHDGTVDGESFMNALLVIHSFLGDMKKRLGFLHGDLTLNNIVLRGLGSGHQHNLPIKISEGKAILVTLPFCPVVLDFGVSSTHAYSTVTDYLGPYLNEIADIVRLYENLTLQSNEEDGLITTTHKYLSLFLGEDWYNSRYYPVPMPLLCDQLTHDAIRTRYLSHAIIPS